MLVRPVARKISRECQNALYSRLDNLVKPLNCNTAEIPNPEKENDIRPISLIYLKFSRTLWCAG